MGKPYSDDLRERAVAAMAGGLSCRAAGAIYGVAPSTAGNWYHRYQQTNSLSPLPMGGDRRWKLGGEVGSLSERLAGKCDLTLSDVQGELAARGVLVGYSSVWRTVHRLGLSFKKTIYASEQDRPDVALARQIWAANQAGLNFASLVFVNETGTTTSMVRTHGWGQKGRKLLAKAPHGHWMA